MGRTLITSALRFIVLIAAQAFLFKNMGYYNLSIPYVYILFIMLLPFGIPNWLLFVLAFTTGIAVDVFYDTLGLHALACSVLAFVRISFINLTVQRDGFDNEPEPKLGIMGLRWFAFYTVILTLFHHLVLFTFETFRLAEIGYTLLRVISSTILTSLLIIIAEFVFYRRKSR